MQKSSKILVPVMTATCPGCMIPSRWVSPRLNMVSSTGGQILWQLYTLKFSGQSSLCRGTQVEGAVVSKPTPTNTCVPLHKDDCPENFSVYSCHRICPPVLDTIFSLGETHLDGIIQPGHVAVITGTKMFEDFCKQHPVPMAISGFEPLDILMSVYMMCKQLKEGRAEVETEYTRLVRPEGNPFAMKLMEDTFTPVDRHWRGFPVIKKSALALKPEFEAHDATKVYEDILAKAPEVDEESNGC